MSLDARFPGTVATSGAGTFPWVNPDNVKVDDAALATVTFDTGTVLNNSDQLIVTNFGFSIPSNQVVFGFRAGIERKCDTANQASDWQVNLWRSGGVVGDNKANLGGFYTTSLVEYTYGDASGSDKWGTTWTPAQVNSSGFGLAFLVRHETAAIVVSIDYIYIAAYWFPTSVSKVNQAPRSQTIVRSLNYKNRIHS